MDRKRRARGPVLLPLCGIQRGSSIIALWENTGILVGQDPDLGGSDAVSRMLTLFTLFSFITLFSSVTLFIVITLFT